MIPVEMTIDRRAPSQVMRLKRLGSFHQSRLSFMRVLTRRLASDAWKFTRREWAVNPQGLGHAVYTAQGPDRAYSLVAFAHDLPADLRSDRVIAEAWDATFALFDGVPTPDDINRLAANVPVQEAGRITERELTLSRANRSVRLWSHVVDRLAQGLQPDAAEIDKVGYLMRTTAVYGSGKFGAADREVIADRDEMQVPFQAEMLTVYLIRTFVRDLVEYMAHCQGGTDAVRLVPDLSQRLGIGNSTGLGMAPFLINHPVLFNNWIMAREEAIARVRRVSTADAEAVALFKSVLAGSTATIAAWHSAHPLQQAKLVDLRADMARLDTYLTTTNLMENSPWDRLVRWAESNLTEEGQELICSLILEPYPDLVDGLAECMADIDRGDAPLNGAMSVGETKALLEESFGWALSLDWSDPAQCARAWYVSEEKLEPRLGERFDEPIAAYEQPLAPARDATAAYHALAGWDVAAPIASFLLQHAEHRHTVRRAQMSRNAPYAEIRDNTICAQMLPIDMLRAKLSFFGATRFDPRSDRWVRICMFSGAPYPEDLNHTNADLWVYPEAPA